MFSSPSGIGTARACRGRLFADRVLDLADHVEPRDRALLHGIYERGMSASEFARAVGARPRAIQRRVRRLVRRLGSPAFLLVLGSGHRWSDTRRRVGEMIFHQGLSQRDVAVRLGLSLHRVRQEVGAIQALVGQELAATGRALEGGG